METKLGGVGSIPMFLIILVSIALAIYKLNSLTSKMYNLYGGTHFGSAPDRTIFESTEEGGL